MKRVSKPPHMHIDKDNMHRDDDGTKKIYGSTSRTRSRSTRKDKNNNRKKKLKPFVNKPYEGYGESSFERHPPNKSQLSICKQELGSTNEGSNADNDHHLDASSASSVPSIPDKRTLQLIIDKLQREDSYEIFGEPVDPNQVEDYSSVIKEPMDFGTMRAKLHERLYKSLEEFEHDLFLIPQNAMRFNSPRTIFFKQAQEIDNLTKKVVHLLKTDPEKFQLELLGTRQRVSNRIRGKSKISIQSQSRSPTTPKSIRTKYTKASKSKRSSNNESPTRKSDEANTRYLSTVTPVYSRDPEILTLLGDDRKFNTLEADPRQAYRSHSLSLQDNDATISWNNCSKMLTHVNQEYNGYKKSLLFFLKDLGPTANRVANQKLHGWSTSACSSQYSESFNAKVSPSPSTLDIWRHEFGMPYEFVKTPLLSRDLLEIPHQCVPEQEKISEDIYFSIPSEDQHAENDSFIVVCGLAAVKPHKSDAKNIHRHNGSSTEAHGNRETSIEYVTDSYEENENQTTQNLLQLSLFTPTAEYMNVSSEVKLNDQVHHSELVSKQPWSQEKSSTDGDNENLMSPYWPLQNMVVPTFTTTALVDPCEESVIHKSQTRAGQILRMNQAIPHVSPFGVNGASTPQVTNHLGITFPSTSQQTYAAYNISYVRMKLNQAKNPSGSGNSTNESNNSLMQQVSYAEGNSLDGRSNQWRSNQGKKK